MAKSVVALLVSTRIWINDSLRSYLISSNTQQSRCSISYASAIHPVLSSCTWRCDQVTPHIHYVRDSCAQWKLSCIWTPHAFRLQVRHIDPVLRTEWRVEVRPSDTTRVYNIFRLSVGPSAPWWQVALAGVTQSHCKHTCNSLAFSLTSDCMSTCCIHM